MKLFRAKKPLTLATICIVWTASLLLLHLRSPAFQSLEAIARDWLATNPLARRSPAHPEIVYLAVDQASKTLSSVYPDDVERSRALQLMKEGFPWNREVYALAIERLLGAGARSVVLDMTFEGPRGGDEQFKAALDRYKDRVAIGSNLQEVSEYADAAQTILTHKPVHLLPSPTLIEMGFDPDSRLGFVNVFADGDQKVRRAAYRTTVLEFFGLPPEADSPELLSLAARALEKGGYAPLIPDTREQLMFRFSEPILPRSLLSIFVEAQWSSPPYNHGGFFRDKIVLIGAAGNESTDRVQTPFGIMLGPMIHLSAINAALNKDFLYETTRRDNIGLICIGGLLAGLLGSIVRKPVHRAAFLLAGLIACYAIAQFLFNSSGFLPIILSPMLALAGSGLTWSAWEQLNDWREKQRLRATFERYVSRDVVKELVDNPQSFLNALGGMRKKITVLFSDVRGFTTLTENADPHALVAQLNEYFDRMVRIVFTNNGTLDKFIGDAVMAHWGSIVSEGEKIDAQRAVQTALDMRAALAVLNTGWKGRGVIELTFGIGINHGEAIVGNLGCEAKMEVSVIGDAVNIASRLEGVTKEYGLDLCIGENVADLVREAFILRSVDLIVVKGKSKPVEVFTVLSPRTAGTADPSWLTRHEEAVQLYRQGEFTLASAAWEEVLAAQPGDKIAKIFRERCASLLTSPVDEEWAGVFAMKTK